MAAEARDAMVRGLGNTHTLSRLVEPDETDVPLDGSLKRSLSQASLKTDERVPLVGKITHLNKVKKLLVANRGEIAIRVCRAATELGLPTVGIYTKEDSYAMHRFRADESYLIGEGLGPLRPYLEIPEIIRVCKESGANAVHPGYGFLSEKADFVKACVENDIIFVGPTEKSIRALGDKVAAREIAIAANVPVVPGTDGPCESVEQALAFADEHGFPVLIKAAHGGGGRGIRVVTEPDELADAYVSATREAVSAFGNGMVFIERYLASPRHIEVQIVGDQHGNMIHLFERDCSIQRRHQKVVEMAPASNLSEHVRSEILSDAIKVCKHVEYSNVGTVEFLYDPASTKHYFIEVNPRVQVEHTVTECITGVDIVKSQICIADGYRLNDLELAQESVSYRGCAIQVRVTTEDPKAGFQPDTGRVHVYRSPGGTGIRLDSSITAGSIISPHYDSLMVKMTALGRSHSEALIRVSRALGEFRVRGVKTNIMFLNKVINHPKFIQNECTTTFIDESPELFEFNSAQDKTTRLLTFLSDVLINGSILKDERLYPDPSVKPIIPQLGTSMPPPDGWRNVLLEKGPQAFAQAVRAHKSALITDTTWRDAHQSLLATRVRTVDLLNIAPATARTLSKCFSLEMWGGATFDVCLRFLHECPWERLIRLRAEVPNIPFQMLLRGANAVGYTSYPDNVVNNFVATAKKCGMDIFRVFDSLNYIPNLEVGINAIHLAGGVVEATICYSGDVLNPDCEYSIEYYLDKVTQLMELKIHILAIKDMAGLLKPLAATKLVGAIRAKFPDLPIHVHTHDTAGTGVASMIAALEAGADIVDCATDALSGLTSQPSLGAVVNALRHTERETELDPQMLGPINDYWEETRRLYRGFESTDLRSGNSDVYQHEMPGGQYTNLQFQASSLGLTGQWPAVKRAYAQANKLCGNIIKVTPSSKVIGDLAQFMVANGLETAEETAAKASSLDFPQSVVSFFQGYLGQPHNGFPKELRKSIIKDLPEVNERPGAGMEPYDFVAARVSLATMFPEVEVSELDVVSYSLYPQVTEAFLRFRHQFGDVSWLATDLFLRPLDEGREIDIPFYDEKDTTVRLLAVGRLLEGGDREVFWEVNGKPRLLTVEDKNSNQIASDIVFRPKATGEPGSVGSPMSGVIIEFKVEEGSEVKAGTPLCVLSAMKMETVITAPIDGIVDRVHAGPLENVTSGDLLITIKPL